MNNICYDIFAIFSIFVRLDLLVDKPIAVVVNSRVNCVVDKLSLGTEETAALEKSFTENRIEIAPFNFGPKKIPLLEEIMYISQLQFLLDTTINQKLLFHSPWK